MLGRVLLALLPVEEHLLEFTQFFSDSLQPTELFPDLGDPLVDIEYADNIPFSVGSRSFFHDGNEQGGLWIPPSDKLLVEAEGSQICDDARSLLERVLLLGLVDPVIGLRNNGDQKVQHHNHVEERTREEECPADRVLFKPVHDEVAHGIVE